MADARLSEAEIRDMAFEFTHACEGCLDLGMGPVVRRTVKEFPTCCGRHAKSQAIPVEERFKSSKVMSWVSLGKAQDASTICCNHVLGEVKGLHRLCGELMRAQKKLPGHPAINRASLVAKKTFWLDRLC